MYHRPWYKNNTAAFFMILLITIIFRYTKKISEDYVSRPHLTNDDEICLRFSGMYLPKASYYITRV